MTRVASPPTRFAPGSWPDGPPPLAPGRAHEASGPAARAFAAALIGAHDGPALWVLRPNTAERLDPYGLARFFDPGRLILVETNAAMDVFWALEEALRSGAASVAVGESLEPAGLTIGRRLQLAAEAGGGVGLLLTPQAQAPRGSAAETRWHAGPAALEDDASAWRWELQKNKHGPLGVWTVALGATRKEPDDQTPNPVAVAAQARR